MVIFALFLGPWNDKSGRKMLIMLPFFGSSFFGGYALLFLGAYGYIADTTSVKTRTIRIAIMDGMFSVAETIGSFINSYIYAALGYYGSFGIASGCYHNILAFNV